MIVLTQDKLYIGAFILILMIVSVLSLKYYIKKVVRDELSQPKKDKLNKYKTSLRRGQRRLGMDTPVRDIDSYIDPMVDDDDDDERRENEEESDEPRPQRRLRREEVMMRDLVDANDRD
jgi:hypothetical protein